MKTITIFASTVAYLQSVSGFSTTLNQIGGYYGAKLVESSSIINSRRVYYLRSSTDDNNELDVQRGAVVSQRRKFLSILSTTTTATAAAMMMNIQPSAAEEALVESSPPPAIKPVNTIEMKTFVDPKGLFILNVPKRFFAIRRTVKGDLPDEATGKGRRGSSIFTAGDMSKAEVIAVER